MQYADWAMAGIAKLFDPKAKFALPGRWRAGCSPIYESLQK